jgi:hypothetical protein
MGTHVDFEFGPNPAPQQTPKPVIVVRRRSLVWWVLGGLLMTAVIYASSVSQSHWDEFRRATMGNCFKTGIGAVGMAIETEGTDTVWLMFASGLKTSYPADGLVETACPSTSGR